MNHLKKIISEEIIKYGFDTIGFSNPSVSQKTSERYKEFISKNYHADMKWLERHYEKKINPKMLWDKVETIVVIGHNYSPENNPLYLNNYKNLANISVYAQNQDYHLIIKEKLTKIQSWLQNTLNLKAKVFVDTSPILEKYFAQKSGIGWQGKHSNIVSKNFGSWLFLAEIFLPIKLSETKSSLEGCGTCEKCLEICPTNAILENYKIDSRKCISYLTIENKGPIPRSLRKKIGNKIYGCDDCLAICPWNKFSKETSEKKYKSNLHQNLLFFLNFNEEKFKEYFYKSSVKRIGWIRFLRNVIIASGNSKNKNLIKYIYKHIDNKSSIVRGACIWSLFELLDEKGKKDLKKSIISREKNKYVLFELALVG